MSKNTGGGVKAKFTVSVKKQIFFNGGFPHRDHIPLSVLRIIVDVILERDTYTVIKLLTGASISDNNLRK